MKIKASHPKSRNFDYVKSPLKRVSTKHKCPVCGKPDWCSYSEDEGIALCMRVSAGSVRQAANGASVHVLRPSYFDFGSAKTATPIRDGGGGGRKIVEKADVERLHSVYSFLLGECLTLNPKHAEQLLEGRCLSDTTIATNLYASMPDEDELPETCRRMRERFGDSLRGVPGFYSDTGGDLKMFYVSGLVIPIRDVRGKISALQIRPDVMLKSKYCWFSTNPEKFENGTSSNAPLHFVKPDLARGGEFTLITEGALKADVISELSECSVIGIAGVTTFNPNTFGAELLEAIPELRRVAIAVDADWRTNKAVRGGLKRLINTLGKTNLQVVVVDWEAAHGKGLDDLLAGTLGHAA